MTRDVYGVHQCAAHKLAHEARMRGIVGEGESASKERAALYDLWQAVITRPNLAFVDPPLHAAIARACNVLDVTNDGA